jgi:hypothetical protein
MNRKGITPRTKEVAVKELTRTVRTILQFIPFGIGSALEVQILDRMAERDQQRFQDFVRGLAEEVRRLVTKFPNTMNKDNFDTDEFRFILREVLTRAAREHREEKVKAFRAILLNSMIQDLRTGFDRKAFFLEVVDALGADHLKLLRHLYSRRREVGAEATESVANIWRTFEAGDEATQNHLYSGLDSLATRMLILNSFIPLRKAAPTKTRARRRKSKRSAIEYRSIDRSIQSFAITKLGIEFVEFISSPVSPPGNVGG